MATRAIVEIVTEALERWQKGTAADLTGLIVEGMDRAGLMLAKRAEVERLREEREALHSIASQSLAGGADHVDRLLQEFLEGVKPIDDTDLFDDAEE